MSTPLDSFLVGLIGEGTTHSLTPALHEREADHHGLRYMYRSVDLTVLARPAEDVGFLLSAGRDLGFNAFNITVPAKQLVLQYLDDLSDEASRLGAVTRSSSATASSSAITPITRALAPRSSKACLEHHLGPWYSWVPAGPEPPPPTHSCLPAWST
jgi:hypothetical protein